MAASGKISKILEELREAQAQRDESELAALGKRSVFKRNFSPLAIVGLSCTLLITWERLYNILWSGLMKCGPSGLLYGFLFCWVGWAATTATMAELSSMWPVASAHYHWTWMLAPGRWKGVLSYVTGWQSVIAWQSATISTTYMTATFLQDLTDDYETEDNFHRWHGALIIFVLILTVALFNIFCSKAFPHLGVITLTLHMILFIIVLVVITVMTPTKNSNEMVWNSFTWISVTGRTKSNGLGFVMGLLTPAFAFIGVDGAVHLAEEVRNPSKVVPWAMMASVGINGVMGFAMLIAILYSLLIWGSTTTRPMGDLFVLLLATTGSRESTVPDSLSNAGCISLSALLVVMMFSANLIVILIASRQLWAFARDNAVPYARFSSSLTSRSRVPVFCICITASVSLFFTQITIGNRSTVNPFISITVTGFLGCYIIPFSLFFYMRIRSPTYLVPGPWSLGRWSLAINGFAILWSILVMFFSLCPSDLPVTSQTMNWSILSTSGTPIFAIVLWFIYGKRTYHGPVIETQLEDAIDEDSPAIEDIEFAKRSLSFEVKELDGESGAQELSAQLLSLELHGDFPAVELNGKPQQDDHSRNFLDAQPVELPA